MLLLLLWVLNINTGAELQVTLSNIQHNTGSVYVALYDNEADFLNTDKVRDNKIVAVSANGTINTSFQNLPPGTYAICCFHDVNGNGQLDTNLFGIPTEPFGFSNNAQPEFGAPSWEKTKFYLKNSDERIAINLKKW